MKKLSLFLIFSLVLVVGLAFTPHSAVAGGHHHRGFHGGSHFVGRPFFPHHHFFFSSVFVAPIVPFGVFAAPPVVIYNAPPVVYAPPPVVYTPPPVAYAPPPPAPAPPPMQSVIQYPHGRYELRGDGVTTPYTWVWIPNPPPPPPAPPTPPAEPQSVPAPTRGQVYSWTDAQGVTTWTNRADAMPDAWRAQAKRVQAAGI